VLFITVSFALMDLLICIYPWPAPGPWGEIKARPLNNSLGTELGLLGASVTFGPVCNMVVFLVILLLAFLSLLICIYI